MVTSRPACLAIGIDCDGRKQVLGLWAGPATGESAKFWLTVRPGLKSRVAADVGIVRCAGLTGLPGAVSVTWPQAVVQRCVAHLIRASLRYASRTYGAPLTRDLKLIYTAAGQATAAAALEAFAGQGEQRSPAIVKLWRAHWAGLTPFLASPPEVRRVIYPANLTEPTNARLRTVTRNRGQPPRTGCPQSPPPASAEPGGIPQPGHRDPQPRMETSAAGIHDLLRRPDPTP